MQEYFEKYLYLLGIFSFMFQDQVLNEDFDIGFHMKPTQFGFNEGHEGTEPTLRNLRDKVWFPGMNKMVQEFVSSCLGCVAAVPFNPSAPISTRTPPGGPWKVCCPDYKGLVGGPRGYYFHVLNDTYSKWPEVAVTKSTKFEKLFPVLNQSFACHG